MLAVSDDDDQATTRDGDRFGQLIYTSYDDGSGSGGGWQVKDRSGHFVDSEIEALTSRIATRFDVDPPLPQYPTLADIEGRPARLSYATIAPGVGAYWHTVDAGTDGSGRPGNVFAHVLLADDITARPGMRPIELWASPGWLRPYGPHAVLEAGLADVEPPGPGGVVTVDSTVAFLLDPGVYRLGVHQVLLDAVYDAMADGRPVVFHTDPSDAPRWIGAVSFFMSPGTARRFTWSTHDKPDLAAVDARRGVHLICVPRDCTVPPSADWVVIDADDDPQLGALGVVAHGSEDTSLAVTVSPWSLLAQAALVDAQTATEVIAHQDSIAREVGDVGLSPVWPLAVAARMVQLGDVGVESSQAIVDDHPTHLETSVRLLRLVDGIYSTNAPDTPQEALDRLTRIRFPGGGRLRAAERLVRCVLHEPRSETGMPVRLNEVPRLRAVDIGRVDDMLDSWLSGMRRSASTARATPAEVQVRHLLHVSDLLVRLVRPGPELDDVTRALAETVGICGIDFLADRSRAQMFVDGVQEITGDTVAAVVIPVINDAIRTPDGLDTVAWEWILGDPRDIDVNVVTDATGSGVLSRRLMPLYIAAMLDDPANADIRPSRRSELALAGIRVLMDGHTSSEADGAAAEIAHLARHVTVTVDHLDELITRFGDAVAPSVALRHVLFSPPSATLDRILDFVSHRPVAAPESDVDSALTVAGARVRIASEWADFDPSWMLALLDSEVKCLLTELEPETYAHLDEGLCILLGALVVAAHSRSLPWTTGDTVAVAHLERRLESARSRLLPRLDQLTELGVIDVAWVAGESMRSRLGPDFAPVAPFALSAADGGGSWMDTVIDARLHANDYRGPTNPEGLRDALWTSIAAQSASTAEKFFLEYRPVAKEWLRERDLGGRETQRPRFSLTHREDNN